MKVSAAVLDALPNEAASIAAAQVDPAAFAAIYDYYFPGVYTYVRYRLTDPQVVDDVTAQIFEKVLGSLSRFDTQQGNFAVWLFTIARNAVTDHLRKRRSWLSLDQVPDHPSALPQPEERAIQQEETEALLHALLGLPDRERDLLALKFAAQLSNRRIAALTGLSESNVGVIVYRALKRLRTILQTEHGLDKAGLGEKDLHE